MSLTLSVQSAKWRVAMDKLRNATRQNMREFMREQFRLLLEQIMAFTPPKNRAQGRRRVEIDVRRVFAPFKPDEKPSDKLAKIIRKADYAAFEAFARNAKVSWRAKPFDAATVAQARDNRGRVRRGTKRTFVLGSRDTQALRTYVRHKQDNVGIARSGWSRALLRMGGTIPSWVSRHGTRFGDVVDRRNVVDRPEILAINRTPWAGRKDEGQRIIGDAMKSRARRLESALRVQLRLAAKQSGFAAA